VFGLGALRSYGDRYQAAPKELDRKILELGMDHPVLSTNCLFLFSLRISLSRTEFNVLLQGATRIVERGEGNSDGDKCVVLSETCSVLNFTCTSLSTQ